MDSSNSKNSLGLIGLIGGGAFIAAAAVAYLLSPKKRKLKLAILNHPNLHGYMCKMGPDLSVAQHKLWDVIKKHPRGIMSSPPHNVVFLTWLVNAMGFKKAIEVGVFCGYGTLAIAKGLPEGGKVVGLDITEEFPSIGKDYWKEEGVHEKVDLRIGEATTALDKMLEEEGEGSYDFAFIDADKDNYDLYYEKCLKLLRVGGIIAVDNVFWHGAVLKPEKEMSAQTKFIFDLNKKIKSDKRVSHVMLPMSDGITLCTKLRSVEK